MRARSFFLAALACCGVWARAQGDPDVVAKIISEGKTNNQTRAHLEYLTGQIGARLTTSLALQRAREWTMKMFREYGLDNVHEELWGEWPTGFDRGKNCYGRMVMPFAREFQFTTRSWTLGTSGPERGQVMKFPEKADEAIADAAKFKGAWVLMPRAQGQLTQEQRDAQDATWKPLKDAGAYGRIVSSRNELVLTGGNYNVKIEEVPTDIIVTVRASDYDAITDGMQIGSTYVEFNLDQRVRQGPVKNYNVVAEIPGTEHPEEVVIVSGHLDSWDGPGSQGACDNGTGTMVALEAARLLMVSGAKPKRTIRFILWTGEEQGLFGSKGYVDQHAAELDKISAVLVDDGGTDYSGGLTCIESMAPMLQKAIDPLNGKDAFPELPCTLRVVASMPRGGGSDHASFNAKGVPGFFWNETGVDDYNYIHHTQHDRVEASINRYLIQSSVAEAVVAFNLACADSMLPRQPQPPPAGGGGK